MFAVTNVDDIVVLAVFFGQAGRSRSAAIRVIIGQFLGFPGILVASVLGALGANLLPPPALPYLGLIPLALGLRAAWVLWRQHRSGGARATSSTPVGIGQVAVVTIANGGDNIGVYLPVFAVAGAARITTYIAVFLVGVALWCAAGWYFSSRPAVAAVLAHWGDLLLPVALIGIGLVILVGCA